MISVSRKNFSYSFFTLFVVALLILTPLLPVTAEEAPVEETPVETTTEETTREIPPEENQENQNDTGGTDGTEGETAEDGTEGETPGDTGTGGTDGTNPDDTENNNGETTENTENGGSGNETAEDRGPEGETEVDTGEVDGSIDIGNDANTTEVTDDNATSTDDSTGDNATSTDEWIIPDENTTDDENNENASSTDDENNENASSTCDSGCDGNTNDTNIEVNNENDADVGNSGSIDGTSGDNTANNNDNVTINTGNINILASIINFINTNIIGSGWNFIIDIAEDYTEDLDLSQLTSENVDGHINVNNNNIATVDNTFTINGSSGDNTANNNRGNVTINTGDVNISTNIINVVNSNLVNTQFLVTVINIWNNWAGDIVLPSQRLDVTYSQVPSTVVIENVDNENEATVENNVDIDGTSGDNDARTIHNATIETGDVIVDNQITNHVNTNLINQQYLDTTVNIFGEWFGYVTGLHDAAQYSENDYQVKISLANQDDPLPTDSGGYLSITNSNEATVINNIEIDANTGGNTSTGNAGDVYISTGNITALSNIFNLINTNIVGGQFVLALVNVFGEWTGDLAYGRPDLVITESLAHDGTTALFPGHTVDVTFTYENNGDSQATDVKIVDKFDENFHVSSSGDGYKVGDGLMEFYLPTIEPGGSGEVSYTLGVNSDVPFGISSAQNEATITSYEKDRNYSDNVTRGNISITRFHPSPILEGIPYPNYVFIEGFQPAFAIEKEHFAETSTIFAGQEISYQIRIKNTGSADSPVVLVIDDLFDPTGENINSQGWDLGKVYNREEIIFDYTIRINEHAYNGLYTNYAQVYYVDSDNNPLASERVEVIIEVLGGLDIPDDSANAEIALAESITIKPSAELEKNSVSIERYTPEEDGRESAFKLVAPAQAADVEVLSATITDTTATIFRSILLIILLIFAIAYMLSHYVDRWRLQD